VDMIHFAIVWAMRGGEGGAQTKGLFAYNSIDSCIVYKSLHIEHYLVKPKTCLQPGGGKVPHDHALVEEELRLAVVQRRRENDSAPLRHHPTKRVTLGSVVRAVSWLQDTVKRKLVNFAWKLRFFHLPGACSPFVG